MHTVWVHAPSSLDLKWNVIEPENQLPFPYLLAFLDVLLKSSWFCLGHWGLDSKLVFTCMGLDSHFTSASEISCPVPLTHWRSVSCQCLPYPQPSRSLGVVCFLLVNVDDTVWVRLPFKWPARKFCTRHISGWEFLETRKNLFPAPPWP